MTFKRIGTKRLLRVKHLPVHPLQSLQRQEISPESITGCILIRRMFLSNTASRTKYCRSFTMTGNICMERSMKRKCLNNSIFWQIAELIVMSWMQDGLQILIRPVRFLTGGIWQATGSLIKQDFPAGIHMLPNRSKRED